MYKGPPPPPPIEPAPAFQQEGKVFRTEDGKIFPWLCGSEFPLLRWELDDVDTKPLLAERYAAGQRMVNVFVTSEIGPDGDGKYDARLGDGGPYSDQQLLDGLAKFVDKWRAAGFNTDASVFQATSVCMPGAERQRRFWSNVLDIAKVRPWMTVSMSKEWWKQLGALDIDGLRRASGQSWDGGGIPDGVAQGIQVAPGIWVCPMRGTHDDYQPGRGDQWPRFTKSAMEIANATRIGCVSGEPMGVDEENQPGRRSNVINDFRWSALNGRLMSMGVYLHTQAGIRGYLWPPRQKEIAAAHFKALNTIPCEVQTGGYAKAMGSWAFGVESYDDMPGGSLRTYGMLVSNTEQWVVVTRPGENYPRNGDMIDPKMLNGWYVEERLEVMGTVLHNRR